MDMKNKGRICETQIIGKQSEPDFEYFKSCIHLL